MIRIPSVFMESIKASIAKSKTMKKMDHTQLHHCNGPYTYDAKKILWASKRKMQR